MPSFVAIVVISEHNSEQFGEVVNTVRVNAENYDDAVILAESKYKTEYRDVFVS